MLSTAAAIRVSLSAPRLPGPRRDQAVAGLHELLLRAARFEVSRRRAVLSHVRGDEGDERGFTLDSI